MNASKTLWMGNIEHWMNEAYIRTLFKEINVTPVKINFHLKDFKKGCCFVEFENSQIASFILHKYNGQVWNNFNMRFNWVNSHLKEQNKQTNVKVYTIYVGNWNKQTTGEELRSFFERRFPSVTSAKIILEPNSQWSKGFGFVDFLDCNDYNRALDQSNVFVFKDMKIIINSAKMRKDEENKTNNSLNQGVDINNYYPFQQHQNTYFPYKTAKYNYYYNTNSSNTNYSTSTQNENQSFTWNNSPNQTDDMINNDDFEKTLQKGLRDVANLYNNSYIKPATSFQCNYYCNLWRDNNNISTQNQNQMQCNLFLKDMARKFKEVKYEI